MTGTHNGQARSVLQAAATDNVLVNGGRCTAGQIDSWQISALIHQTPKEAEAKHMQKKKRKGAFHTYLAKVMSLGKRIVQYQVGSHSGYWVTV